MNVIMENKKQKVSEKCFANIGNSVYFIEKKYTEFDTKTFGTYSVKEDEFIEGILCSKKIIDDSGYINTMEYVVKLTNGDIITIQSSPLTYFFKNECI